MRSRSRNPDKLGSDICPKHLRHNGENSGNYGIMARSGHHRLVRTNFRSSRCPRLGSKAHRLLNRAKTYDNN
jgi:hypothetical protein